MKFNLPIIQGIKHKPNWKNEHTRKRFQTKNFIIAKYSVVPCIYEL